MLHALAADELVYQPTAHGVQADASPSEYLPDWQAWQEDDAAGLYWPPSHAVHDDSEVELVYL
jgi:hypothetical protein